MKNIHPNNPWQPEIREETPLYDGYKHILTTQLQSLEKELSNQDGVTDLQPNFIHKIRVQSRKLLTAIKLFKQVTSKKLLVKAQIRAKTLMDLSGPMRNLDIFYTACKDFNNQSTLENRDLFLQGVIWNNRNRIKKNTLKLFKIKGKKLAVRVLKTTSKIISSEYEPTSTTFFEWSRLSLMKVLDDFKTTIKIINYSKKGLHAFRLKIKFLRYGLEIMGDAIASEQSHLLYKTLKKGQKILGLINDLYFQIEQTKRLQSALKQQKETVRLTDESLEVSFLKNRQNLLETNTELFRNWVETTSKVIDFD